MIFTVLPLTEAEPLTVFVEDVLQMFARHRQQDPSLLLPSRPPPPTTSCLGRKEVRDNGSDIVTGRSPAECSVLKRFASKLVRNVQ